MSEALVGGCGYYCAIVLHYTVVSPSVPFLLMCGECNRHIGTHTFESICSAFDSAAQNGLFI